MIEKDTQEQLKITFLPRLEAQQNQLHFYSRKMALCEAFSSTFVPNAKIPYQKFYAYIPPFLKNNLSEKQNLFDELFGIGNGVDFNMQKLLLRKSFFAKQINKKKIYIKILSKWVFHHNYFNCSNSQVRYETNICLFKIKFYLEIGILIRCHRFLFFTIFCNFTNFR